MTWTARIGILYLWFSGVSIGMIPSGHLNAFVLAAQALALGLLGYRKISRFRRDNLSR